MKKKKQGRRRIRRRIIRSKEGNEEAFNKQSQSNNNVTGYGARVDAGGRGNKI